MPLSRRALFVSVVCLVVSALAGPAPGVAWAQEKAAAAPDPAKVLAAAREIMEAQQYCGLVTRGADGLPSVRTMNPFVPDEQMVVWFATNPRSRKAQEIRNDPRVTLYYADHSKATGYVALTGRAELVDDMKEILKRKRAYWDQAFPGLKNIVLIKVVPERIEVINYKAGFVGDPATWRSVSLDVKK